MRTIIHTHWCMYCLTIHDMFLSILKFMAKGKHSTSWTFSSQWFLHIWWCQPQIYQVWHLNAYDGLSHLGYEPSIGVFYWSITLPLPTHHHLLELRFMTMVVHCNEWNPGRTLPKCIKVSLAGNIEAILLELNILLISGHQFSQMEGSTAFQAIGSLTNGRTIGYLQWFSET
jgi:hypothetical protein